MKKRIASLLLLIATVFLCAVPVHAADDAQMPGQGIHFTGEMFLICAAIGLAVGLITVLVLRAQLKSVRSKHYAGDYVVPGSFVLRKSRDIFLYRNVTRREKPKNNNK